MKQTIKITATELKSDNDRLMKRPQGKILYSVSLLSYLLLMCSCATSLQPVMDKFEKYPPQKAIALGVDSITNKYVVYGYSKNQNTERIAIDDAIRICKDLMTRKGYFGQCILYAVNDEIINGKEYIPIEERVTETDNKIQPQQISSKDDTAETQADSESDEDMIPVEKKGFANIAYAMINDAFDLLPAEIVSELREDDEIDEIMDSVINSSLSDTFNNELDPKNCGVQLSYILINVFGENPPEDIIIPQTFYYEGYKSVTNLSKYVKTARKKIDKSPKAYRDKYNLALNLFINKLVSDYRYSNKKIPRIPKQGTYIRDQEEHFYPYEVVRK